MSYVYQERPSFVSGFITCLHKSFFLFYSGFSHSKIWCSTLLLTFRSSGNDIAIYRRFFPLFFFLLGCINIQQNAKIVIYKCSCDFYFLGLLVIVFAHGWDLVLPCLVSVSYFAVFCLYFYFHWIMNYKIILVASLYSSVKINQIYIDAIFVIFTAWYAEYFICRIYVHT